ncbi:unnamed protein product [Mytilus coruscus]|uniref:CCHC-type domain-containing protein n=1 Tax=Mytilus coruscus TaxID=42192 RepID=A0A6J8DTW4_MYTCO|nr:unnamed protein product [Mytilus coruscus]
MPGWKDKIQCYNCGRFGHFRNECRALRSLTMETMVGETEQCGLLHYNSRHRRMERRKLTWEQMLQTWKLVRTLTSQFIISLPSFLIDTGATVTLVSHALFYRIQKKERPDLGTNYPSHYFGKWNRAEHSWVNDYDTLTSKLQMGIIEPCEKFVKRDNALLAKTLVEAREHVPIRLLNVSNNVTTIRAGTIVGEISPVEDVITMTGNTSKEHKIQN